MLYFILLISCKILEVCLLIIANKSPRSMEAHGGEFFNQLLEQNIRWVPGASIPPTLIAQPNNTFSVTFTTTIGLQSQDPFTFVYPSSGTPFTSWAQRSAILKDAPHPEGAKLLQNYVVSSE